jgi:Zn-dependent protease
MVKCTYRSMFYPDARSPAMSIFALSILYAAILTSLLFVLSLAMHELGHAAAGRFFGLPIRRIVAGNGPWLIRLWGARFEVRLLGFNGGCEFGRPLCQEAPRVRFWVALAGPLASLAAAGLFGVAGLLWHGGIARVCVTMAQANVALAVFNLLPVPPLDGWRVLDAALEGLGIWRLTPGQRVRLHAAGGLLLAVGIAAFFAARWGLL